MGSSGTLRRAYARIVKAGDTGRRALRPGQSFWRSRPEELNITDPALIEGIHGQYAAAGSRIVNANTFGASAHKLAGSAYTLEQVITAGIENCKRACAPYGALTALDVGPLGELLEPSGTLAFEDAVAEYARIVKAGEAAGAEQAGAPLPAAQWKALPPPPGAWGQTPWVSTAR